MAVLGQNPLAVLPMRQMAEALRQSGGAFCLRELRHPRQEKSRSLCSGFSCKRNEVLALRYVLFLGVHDGDRGHVDNLTDIERAM